MQTSAEFTQITDLDPILTDIFYQHYDRELGVGTIEMSVMPLFNILTSGKAKETDLRIGGFTDPQVFEGIVQYQTVDRGYEIEYSHTEYATGFAVERKLWDDRQYGPIFGAAEEMGVAFGRKRRKDAASVFNNAFSGSYLGYDSKALCADDHPRSRLDSTSVDNLSALPLTEENLETAIIAHQGLGDDLGEEITIMPDTLVVPRALRKTALEIVGSPLRSGTGNNDLNVYQGMRVSVDPYLTDTNAWFTVDSGMARRYLKWYERVPTEFMGMEDFDTYVRKFKGYMRYSFGWSDFRWIYGNNPS